MAINLNRYVSITSGIGAANVASTRDLSGRFFTTNALAPTGTVLEFTSSAQVGDYFGTTSDEYKRALFYFAWISKNITAPTRISFYRWAEVDVPSTIYGKVATYATGQFTSVTTGDLTLTLGGFTHHLTGIDLHLVGSLAAVATAVETAVNAYSAGGAAWTAATVDYDATRKSFNLVSGLDGDDVVAVTAGSITDIASLLGWLTGATFSDGLDEQTVTELLTTAADQSNNFGSFAFVDALTLDQVTEAAEWNNALNITFMYSVPVSLSNAISWLAALDEIGGVSLTIAPLSTEYPEQAPMMQLAATNYYRNNSVSNYMYQVFDLTPSVTTDADANMYDALRINYYGQTQTAGQNISFYQRGVMLGLAVDPADQNVYANEIWLKDAMSTALISLLLALAKVSANNTGRAQILSIVQGVINQALLNGTISVGKPLTDIQKAYITSITDDNLAWQQVFNTGYWVDVAIVPYVEDAVTKYKAVYTLIYSKDDIIRKIEGSDILI